MNIIKRVIYEKVHPIFGVIFLLSLIAFILYVVFDFILKINQ